MKDVTKKIVLPEKEIEDPIKRADHSGIIGITDEGIEYHSVDHSATQLEDSLKPATKEDESFSNFVKTIPELELCVTELEGCVDALEYSVKELESNVGELGRADTVHPPVGSGAISVSIETVSEPSDLRINSPASAAEMDTSSEHVTTTLKLEKENHENSDDITQNGVAELSSEVSHTNVDDLVEYDQHEDSGHLTLVDISIDDENEKEPLLENVVFDDSMEDAAIKPHNLNSLKPKGMLIQKDPSVLKIDAIDNFQ